MLLGANVCITTGRVGILSLIFSSSGNFICIREVRIQNNQMDGIMVVNPFQYLFCILCDAYFIAFSHHFPFEKISHMAVSVRY